MNEVKQRRRGFLAALLAAVLILGTPGVTAMAANYWYGANPGNSYTELSNGAIVNQGDVIHGYYSNSSGDVLPAAAKVSYPGTTGYTTTSGGVGLVISGGPYIVAGFGSGSVLFINAPATSGSGASTASDTPVSGYYRSLAALISDIRIEGGQTHGYGFGSALPYSVMKALADNPDDVLIFKTDYKGYHYEFTIQVGEDVKELIKPEIPWYGPYWLAKNFFDTTVIEKLPDYS